MLLILYQQKQKNSFFAYIEQRGALRQIFSEASKDAKRLVILASRPRKGKGHTSNPMANAISPKG